MRAPTPAVVVCDETAAVPASPTPRDGGPGRDGSQALTRRALLAAGGGLVVGCWLPARAEDRKEPPPETAVGQAAERATGEAGRIAHNAFVRIARDGTVTLVMHKVEMGQGTYTSMAMLLAEELEVDPSTVRLEHAPADNALYGDPLLGGQVTGGSTSVRGAWKPLRVAGAAARILLVDAAAERWGVASADCRAENGAVLHPASGRRLGYGELVDAAAPRPLPKEVPLKPASQFRLIGRPVHRLDSAEKVDGRARFGLDVRLPGQRFAVVAASPVVGGRLAGADDAKALAVRGVREVLKTGDAVAVVADHVWAAKQGLAALAPTWDDGPNAGFTIDALRAAMDAAVRDGKAAVARADGDPGKALAARGVRRVDAVYEMPFLAHATMEPVNCTVALGADGCDLHVGTQVPTLAQGAAAKVLGLPPERVRVHNQYLGGGFGRRLEVDFVVRSVEFARRAKTPGPIQFVWTREEDVRHDMFRPFYRDRLSAALGADGRPTAWTHRVTGSSIMARFAPQAVQDGVDPDAVEGARHLPYAIPHLRVDYVRHEPPVPTAFWRGVGATHNVFVVESFIDELAAAAGADPVAYRLSLLQKSPRTRRVLERAAALAGWGRPPAPAAGRRVGRGVSAQFAFGSYLAQVAEVAVDDAGAVQVTRVVCAVDCGQVVNPDTVRAQIESGIAYGLGAALWNEITFAKGRVVQSNFHDYRALRQAEMPVVDVEIVGGSDEPGGIGEPGTSAIAPAVTNAIFAATGVRVRRLPIGAQAARA